MNNFKYKRILILGGPGSGKSTLAERMHEYTLYPVYHIDAMLHDSNWKVKPKEEWDNYFKVFLNEEKAIVDGNYSSVMESRIEWSDLIIFIKLGTPKRMLRILNRYLKKKLSFDDHLGVPIGAKEKLGFDFISWSLRWNLCHRKQMKELLNSIKDKKVLIIKEPKKLDLEELLEIN